MHTCIHAYMHICIYAYMHICIICIYVFVRAVSSSPAAFLPARDLGGTRTRLGGCFFCLRGFLGGYIFRHVDSNDYN